MLYGLAGLAGYAVHGSRFERFAVRGSNAVSDRFCRLQAPGRGSGPVDQSTCEHVMIDELMSDCVFFCFVVNVLAFSISADLYLFNLFLFNLFLLNVIVSFN